MLSDRQRQILSVILAANGPVTGADIALELGSSTRTVQREIARINRLGIEVESSYRGYRIKPSSLDGPWLEEARLARPEPESTPVDHALLKALTQSDDPMDIDDLSEALYVSTPVLERSVRRLRPELERYRLKLTRHRNKLRIEGRETDKRALIGRLLVDEATTSFSSWDRLAAYFDGLDIEALKQIVLDAVDSQGFRIKTGYTQNLIANMAVALYRMRSDSYITEQPASDRREGVEHAIAREICRACSERQRIAPDTGDIDYLASLLTGQIEPKEHPAAPARDLEVSELVTTVERIVNEVFDAFQLHIGFSQSLYNFSMHIKALIERTEAIPITDTEILENVKMNCPFVYELSLLISKRLADAFGIEITDGETGFICIHVGLLIENMTAEKKVRIALVCDRYQGVSERIREEIERRFADVATVLDYDPVHPDRDVIADADLVVTTRNKPLPLHNVVFVSPFFTPSDYLKIENAVGIRLRERNAERTKALLEPFFDERLFTRRDIVSQDEAIRFLGKQLIDMGIVDETFIASVFMREEMSPTSFFGLFAIPHALEMSAERTMVAVLLSEEGVAWGGETVHIVLMIAVCHEDRKRFMEIYNTVVRALCDKQRAHRLAGAQTLGEFLERLVYD